MYVSNSLKNTAEYADIKMSYISLFEKNHLSFCFLHIDSKKTIEI